VQDWAFAALCFNMFCRGVSTAQIQLGCLLPTSDGFLVDLVASKTNLVGQKCERKNVAGNPLDPSVCPRLALAVCLALWNRGTDAKETFLFAGGHKAATFGERLRTILKSPKCVQQLQTAGIDPSVVGTHSLRKGGATLCTTSLVCNVVAVCKRGDWAHGVTGECACVS
jgi:hypothetical protein